MSAGTGELVAFLVLYLEKCHRVAVEELALWRIENAARIAALDTVPETEKKAEIEALLTEAMAPLVRALDDAGRVVRSSLH